MTLVQGVIELPADAYHADPCDTPSLSRSVAHLLCTSSPKHAWTAHPKLNPDYQSAEKEAFDIGTAAHALLLEGETGVIVVDADDWRTKAAREQRDDARANGQTPLLAKHWTSVQAMVAAAQHQLDHIDVAPGMFCDGKPEQSIIWQEPNGVMCRARLDWLHDDLTAIDDYKTTSRTANPEQWSRSMFSSGYDLQVAFYQRGIRQMTGHETTFRFCVQETFPPYALAVFQLGPDALTLAEAKVEYAIAKWKQCLDTNDWPAYPLQVCHVEMPPWEELRWHDREMRDAA